MHAADVLALCCELRSADSTDLADLTLLSAGVDPTIHIFGPVSNSKSTGWATRTRRNQHKNDVRVLLSLGGRRVPC